MRRFSPLMLPLLLALTGVVLGSPLGLATEDEGKTVAPQPVHPSSVELKKELSGVIGEQLAAFRANDFTKAYSFAASEIRALYPAKDFEIMVRTAYPIIAKSGTVEFGMIFDQGDKAVVNVRIADFGDKTSAQYRYLLKKEERGWRIAGVAEIKPTGLSV